MPPRKHNKKLTIANPYPNVSPSAPETPTNEWAYLQSFFAVKPQAPKGAGGPGQGVLMLTPWTPVRVKVPVNAKSGSNPTLGEAQLPAPSIGPKAQQNINRDLPRGKDTKKWNEVPDFPVRYSPTGKMVLKEPINIRAQGQVRPVARPSSTRYRPYW
ncbi:hypothetical protein HGRIS_000057 [Hohenbuehelia grisea]|uniref:Uncharacterized protein n=1 Tax=Hohenbuehelia grisea TaxID=104357 RepID=A0ABR3JPX6_9AGAR